MVRHYLKYKQALTYLNGFKSQRRLAARTLLQATKLAAVVFTVGVVAGCASRGPVENTVSSEFAATRNVDKVGQETIVSYQLGSGKPTVIFAHGIPSSSYLWRNVMPIVAEQATTVAFDLPGYGESSVPIGGDYSYASLFKPMANWLEGRLEEKFILVVNDLGSVLGLDWAARNPERIAGIVLVEAVFMPAEQWYEQLTFLQKAMFAMMRADWVANTMIVKKPRLQSMIWGMAAFRDLNKEERSHYLAPYEDMDRRRVLRYGPGPATFPKGGRTQHPEDFAAVMNRNAEALVDSDVPILLLTADPGFIVQQPAIEYARQNFAELTVVEIGAGKHFLPEDQPTAIGNAIRDWVQLLELF